MIAVRRVAPARHLQDVEAKLRPDVRDLIFNNMMNEAGDNNKAIANC